MTDKKETFDPQNLEKLAPANAEANTSDSLEQATGDMLGEFPTPTPEAPSIEPLEVPEKAKPKTPTKGRGRGRGKASSSKAAAEMFVSILDSMRELIGDYKHDAQNKEMVQHRKSTCDAWAAYIEETGAEPPAWAVVMFATASYVAPAFVQEKSVTRFQRWKANFKAWRVQRKEMRVKP